MQGTCDSSSKQSVIQAAGAKTGHKEEIRNITRAAGTRVAEACEEHQKLTDFCYPGRKSRTFALCSMEWVNASLSTLPYTFASYLRHDTTIWMHVHPDR